MDAAGVAAREGDPQVVVVRSRLAPSRALAILGPTRMASILLARAAGKTCVRGLDNGFKIAFRRRRDRRKHVACATGLDDRVPRV